MSVSVIMERLTESLRVEIQTMNGGMCIQLLCQSYEVKDLDFPKF